MRRVFKWIGIVLGSIVGLIAVAALALFIRANSRLNATHKAPDTLVSGFGDSASLARGEHIMRIHSCQFCHGDQLQGRVFLDIPPALAVASNLTPGQGGVGATYSGEDWDRAIRYGIRPNGTMLLPFMPYDLFNHLNDRDAGHLAAYLESLQPVDNPVPPSRAKFPGKLIFGNSNLLPKKRAAAIPILDEAPTAEYGKYLASTTCVACHGDRLQGGEHPDPTAPPAPPLPPTSAWTDEQFALTMRTGRTPARQLSEHMPWKFYADMTDAELAALRAYIRTIAAGPAATN
ncbi:MAG: cytochrome c [Gemmatimonadota bacterium]|nr:cytochrome c [Gemmatimonadota bacterium]